MPKRERRFPLSAIQKALTMASIEPEQKARFLRELDRTMPKRGRREERDGDAIQRVIALLGDGEEDAMSINAAAALVAKDYPVTMRDAARKRLARKTKAVMKEVESEIEAATQVAKMEMAERWRVQEAAEREIEEDRRRQTDGLRPEKI